MLRKNLALALFLLASVAISAGLSFFLTPREKAAIDSAAEARRELRELTSIHARQLACRLGRTESVVHASARFASLIWQDNSYLFSLDLSCRSSLQRGEVNAEIRKVFAKHQTAISSQATVYIQRRGSQWLINDMGYHKQYYIVKSWQQAKYISHHYSPSPLLLSRSKSGSGQNPARCL